MKHEYLLKDLLYCGNCKRKMQYKVYRSKNKQRFLYEVAGFNCSLLYKKKCKNKTYIGRNVKNIILEFQKGKWINNDFLKEIINKIEIYSKNRIEITFNL